LTKQPAVILCGNSLLMAGLALDLQGDFQVVKAADSVKDGELRQAGQPAAILVDGSAGNIPEYPFLS
jgi:hypothetical protein